MLNLSEYATIGVFGHFGNRNLGDEAIIAAVVQNIRRRLPNTKVIGFSLKPGDTGERHGIPAYPIRHLPETRLQPPPSFDAQDASRDKSNLDHEPTINANAQDWLSQLKAFIKRIPLGKTAIAVARALIGSVPALIIETRFLRRSYKILIDVDLLIIAGSNQLMDSFGGCSEGPSGFPYTLLKWVTMAKLAGAKVAYVSVGAGPITSKLSKSMIKLALKFSDYISFRDLRSQQLIEALGIKGATTVFPDLAYSLRPNGKPRERHRSMDEGRKPTVGINPMPVYDDEYWYIHDADKYACYVKNLANFAAVLLRDNYPLVFWGTQPKDQDVIADILTYLEMELGEALDTDTLVSRPTSVDSLLDVIASFDIVIATRFHGIVLSLYSGIAVMSVCYHKKMDDVMRDMGQAEYSVDLDVLDAKDLLVRFKRLEKSMDIETEKIKLTTEQYRVALARQYDWLFGVSSGPESD